jgi:hypothetical protein
MSKFVEDVDLTFSPPRDDYLLETKTAKRRTQIYTAREVQCLSEIARERESRKVSMARQKEEETSTTEKKNLIPSEPLFSRRPTSRERRPAPAGRLESTLVTCCSHPRCPARRRNESQRWRRGVVATDDLDRRERRTDVLTARSLSLVEVAPAEDGHEEERVDFVGLHPLDDLLKLLSALDELAHPIGENVSRLSATERKAMKGKAH